MKIFLKMISFIFILSLCTIAFPSLATEKILYYESNITVNSDASILIFEMIQVQTEQDKIKHGIYRDFPTSYTNRMGSIVNVPFEVQSIKRDQNGHWVDEPYTITSTSNGKRIYIGNPKVILNPGTYTYLITYTTNRQLGYFADFDELYWNVTGNGWSFPIDKVKAEIVLPGGAKAIQLFGYTGFIGQKGKDYEQSYSQDSNVVFTTNRPLMPQEGLTVAVAWPKGFVEIPTATDNFLFSVRDNTRIIFEIIGLVFVASYYLCLWLYIKNASRPKGTIIPLFHPPEDLSPGAISYIYNFGFILPSRASSASIVNLAVKKIISLESHPPYYIIKQLINPLEKNIALPKEEMFLLLNLFNNKTNEPINLGEKYNTTVSTTIMSFMQILSYEYTDKYLNFYHRYFFFGIFLNILLLFLSSTFFLIIPIIILIIVAISSYIKKFFVSVTPLGRKTLDEIEGFKMFLSTTAEEHLDQAETPALTTELFDQYLPFAIALGVEKHWILKFAPLFENASQPKSYFYNSKGLYATGLTQAMIISAASLGSSSGSSGGGSSGGGGGGGGGGGW